MSMTLDLLKQRRLEKQHNRGINSKKVESELKIELLDMLAEQLAENDRVMIEVNPNIVSEFINILADSSLQIYNYEQLDSNKFVFENKEFVL